MTIPSNAFLYVNIAIVALYLIVMAICYHNGILYGLIDLFYTVICVAVAYFLSPILANLFPLVSLKQFTGIFLDIDPIVNTVVYFGIIFIVLKLLGFVIVPMFKNLTKVPVLGQLNKMLGLVLGFVSATIVVLLLSILLKTPLIKNGQEVREGTFFRYVDSYSQTAVNYFVDHVDLNVLKDKFSNLDVDGARDQFKNWFLDQEIMK